MNRPDPTVRPFAFGLAPKKKESPCPHNHAKCCSMPVAVYPASQEIGIDFDWLDKRSMDPVGYKRVNKRTGKEILSADIVKGIKQGDGDYVILSEDEIKAAYPKSTQTIEIESFAERFAVS